MLSVKNHHHHNRHVCQHSCCSKCTCTDIVSMFFISFFDKRCTFLLKTSLPPPPLKVLLTVQAADLQVEVRDAGEQAPAVGHFHAGIEGGVLEAVQPLQMALQAQAALQALHGPADGGHLRRLQRASHILPGGLQGTTHIPCIGVCSVPACCCYYCTSLDASWLSVSRLQRVCHILPGCLQGQTQIPYTVNVGYNDHTCPHGNGHSTRCHYLEMQAVEI